MDSGQSLNLPSVKEVAVYVVKGRVRYGGEEIPAFRMAQLNPNEAEPIEALEPSLLVLIGGEQMSRRYIEWNFVSSRPERIELAKRMWRNREFPTVPGDEEEFIPLPAE